jgi:uncharacterized protein (TIGR03083 family)
MDDEQPHGELANRWAQIASEGFADVGRYLQSLPHDEWEGPSGASEWTIRHLAGHIAGEAVWFPNLIRGVTRGEVPYPSSLYTEMMGWEPERLTQRIAEAADQIPAAVDEATAEDLESPVDMGFAHMPIWRATYISAIEGVFHNWDAKARREPHAAIPREWAVDMAPGLTDFAPNIAHRSKVRGAQGIYLLEVEDFGPVTVTAQDNTLTVHRGTHETPDVTLILTPDEYVRLITGRLGGDVDTIRVEGSRGMVVGLTRILGGIANGD